MTSAQVICVTDDDAQMRAMICKMLSDGGYETVQAADGKEALKQVASTGAKVVVLDIIMPQHEGLETIPQLRERFPDTRILAISGGGAMGAQAYLDQAILLGADDVLMKPFEMQVLIGKVASLAEAAGG